VYENRAQRAIYVFGPKTQEKHDAGEKQYIITSFINCAPHHYDLSNRGKWDGQGMVVKRNTQNILFATARMKWPFARIARGWNGNTKRKEL
jgi:hypothetical protein